MGTGGYTFVPRGFGWDLGSTGGAPVFVFSNPSMAPSRREEIHVTRVHHEPWQEREYPHAPHAGFYKSLRLAEADVLRSGRQGPPAGFLRLWLMSPGHADPQEHVYGVWEGMIFLAGDMLLAGSGRVVPGSYMGNPAEFWHAPMVSQFGAVLLCETAAPIDMTRRDYEGGKAIVEGYLDTTSWLEPPRHAAWEDGAVPQAARRR